MNPEIPKLEARYEELMARAAAARIKGDYITGNKFELLARQCHEKIMESIELDNQHAVKKD